MENTEQLLTKAIEYYRHLAQNIDYNPLPGDESTSKWQLVMWLEELLEYRLSQNYLVLQYNLNSDIDIFQQLFEGLNKALKDNMLELIAIPNTASLVTMSKEELKNVYNLIGKLIKEDE